MNNTEWILYSIVGWIILLITSSAITYGALLYFKYVKKEFEEIYTTSINKLLSKKYKDSIIKDELSRIKEKIYKAEYSSINAKARNTLASEIYDEIKRKEYHTISLAKRKELEQNIINEVESTRGTLEDKIRKDLNESLYVELHKEVRNKLTEEIRQDIEINKLDEIRDDIRNQIYIESELKIRRRELDIIETNVRKKISTELYNNLIADFKEQFEKEDKTNIIIKQRDSAYKKIYKEIFNKDYAIIKENVIFQIKKDIHKEIASEEIDVIKSTVRKRLLDETYYKVKNQEKEKIDKFINDTLYKEIYNQIPKRHIIEITRTVRQDIKEEQRNFILNNEKDIIREEIFNDISLRISQEEERIIKSNIKETIGKKYIPIVKKELYSELLESVKKEEREKEKLKEKFRIIKEQEEHENSKQKEKERIIAGLSNQNIEIRNHCGMFFYIALDNYYPTRFQEAPNEVWNTRRNIWDFKDGDIIYSIYSRVETILARINEINRTNNLRMDLIFIPIPASTNEKNRIRYRRFCSEVCKNLNIENGYNAITIKQDREALKGSVGTNKIKNLSFNTEIFRGKTVILFDDVKTTGASFEQVGRALENNGARNIIGMFLGETYSEYIKGEPYWY